MVIFLKKIETFFGRPKRLSKLAPSSALFLRKMALAAAGL
jgi:hypothetical protein